MSADPSAIDRFVRCVRGYGDLLERVAADQWANETPCTEWDVRALVNHVTGELAWVEPLVSGSTIEQVGDRFAGDVLGADPKASYAAAAGAATAAVSSPGAIDGSVHLSYGDDSTESYVDQLSLDCLIHGWDLARGTGQDERLDDDLVSWALGYTASMADAFASSGMYAAPVPVGADVSAQVRLLAVLGRDARHPG